MSFRQYIAVPELVRALHPRHLLFDSTLVDDSCFACQHVGPIDEDKMQHSCTSQCGSLFIRNADYWRADKVYNAVVGEETPLLPGGEPQPERCAASQRAYDDYVHFLAQIGQLEPLPSHAPAEAVEARQRIEAMHANTTLGFQRYLVHRGDASCTSDPTRSRTDALKHSWRFLRAGTVELLSRPRLPPLNWWRKCVMGFILYTLVYNLVVQIRGCMLVKRVEPHDLFDWDGPLRTGVTYDQAYMYSQVLLLVLIIKECFFITFYVIWLVVVVGGVSVALVLGLVSGTVALFIVLPAYMIYSQCASSDAREASLKRMRRFMRHARRNPLGLDIQRNVIKQANVVAHMALNLSILFRIKEWVVAMFLHRSRAVDFSVKLTSVANVMFNVALLLCEADQADNYLLVAEVSVLLVLFHEMVADEIHRRTMLDAFKDLSQNRLTKVEMALLLTKCAEDIVCEPTAYNFVEHFYTSPDDDATSFRVVANEEWRRVDGGDLRSIRISTQDPRQPPVIDSSSDEEGDEHGETIKYC